jgi:hypothetical protein
MCRKNQVAGADRLHFYLAGRKFFAPATQSFTPQKWKFFDSRRGLAGELFCSPDSLALMKKQGARAEVVGKIFACLWANVPSSGGICREDRRFPCAASNFIYNTI